MDNIYQTWTHFNKLQNDLLKGEEAMYWLKKSGELAEEWGHLPYPTGEDWKYVNFGELPRTRLSWPSEKGETRHVADEQFISIEVKNFHYPERFKSGDWPESLSIESEQDSLNDLKDLEGFQSQLSSPFQELKQSFVGQGLFLRFKKSYEQKKPVKIILDIDHFNQKDLYIHYNLNVVVEKGVKADVYFEVQAQSFCGLANFCVSSKLFENSHLNFFQKEWGGPQSRILFSHQSELESHSVLKNHDFTFPSQWSRHNIDVDLQKEGAEVSLLGAYFNDKSNFCDHHTAIRHSKGHTESREDYRGLLTGEAQAVFNGKIFIAEKASKSDSEQINKNLMLSEKAEIDTKPELQIYNDDVKAAHGATVGQLDEEQRFYLQSRGYSREQAAQILSKAFVYDLLKNESPLTVDFYNSDIEEVLSRIQEG